MRAVSGVLIAFEGLDQSGKETQARRLRARLEAAGREVVTLTFPCYETSIAREIERALRGERDYTPDVLQLLFIANRYEYRPRIADWIGAGRVVLCDRYLASSIAYGEAQGLDPAWLRDVQRGLPAPDVTLLIDIAPETAVARKAVDRDRFERDLALLERVRASYLRQAAAPGWHRVDGERAIDDVQADVLRVIAARPGLLSAP
jgi:dTMP kinase